MLLDWNAVSSIIGLVTALAAIVALFFEARRSRRALQTDAHLKLVERFFSANMMKTRQMAAQKLMAKKEPNFELFDVLGFFVTLSILCNNKVVNTKLAFDQFAYWVIRYWLSAKEIIRKDRELDPLSFNSLELLVNRLLKEEKRHGYSSAYYTKEYLQIFLLEEARTTKKSTTAAKENKAR
jgi:hypothetical protein